MKYGGANLVPRGDVTHGTEMQFKIWQIDSILKCVARLDLYESDLTQIEGIVTKNPLSVKHNEKSEFVKMDTYPWTVYNEILQSNIRGLIQQVRLFGFAYFWFGWDRVKKQRSIVYPDNTKGYPIYQVSPNAGLGKILWYDTFTQKVVKIPHVIFQPPTLEWLNVDGSDMLVCYPNTIGMTIMHNNDDRKTILRLAKEGVDINIHQLPYEQERVPIAHLTTENVMNFDKLTGNHPDFKNDMLKSYPLPQSMMMSLFNSAGSDDQTLTRIRDTTITNAIRRFEGHIGYDPVQRKYGTFTSPVFPNDKPINTDMIKITETRLYDTIQNMFGMANSSERASESKQNRAGATHLHLKLNSSIAKLCKQLGTALSIQLKKLIKRTYTDNDVDTSEVSGRRFEVRVNFDPEMDPGIQETLLSMEGIGNEAKETIIEKMSGLSVELSTPLLVDRTEQSGRPKRKSGNVQDEPVRKLGAKQKRQDDPTLPDEPPNKKKK